MKIGGYKIDLTEVDVKIWVILGLVLVAIIFLLFFRPKETPPDPSNFPAPGFGTAQVEKLIQENPDWINQYQDLGKPDDIAQFLDLATNKGEFVDFRVYIPEDPANDFPDLFLTQYGLTFTSGFFVSPSVKLPVDEAPDYFAGQDEVPLQLAFPVGEDPGTNQILQVQGLIWWRSDKIKSPEDPAAVSPTILVGSYQTVPEEEIISPAKYVAAINQNYTQNPYSVSIKKIEWAPGSQIRACLSVENISASDQPMWEGVAGDAVAQYDPSYGAVSGSPSEASAAFLDSEDLLPQRPVTGYIAFGAPDNPEKPPVGSPQDQLGEDPLTINFPGIDAGNIDTDEISIDVYASQFQSIEAISDASERIGCN